LAPTYKVIGSSFRWEAGRKDEGRKRADALMFDVRGLRFDVKMSVESVKAPWEPRSFTELRGEAVGKGTQRK
jgi:hypothetical protein